MLASEVLKIGNPNKVDQDESLHTVTKKVIQHKLFLMQTEGNQFWTLPSWNQKNPSQYSESFRDAIITTSDLTPIPMYLKQS